MRLIDVDALTKRLIEFCNKICPYTAKARDIMCGSCFMGLALETVEDAPTIEPETEEEAYERGYTAGQMAGLRKTGKWVHDGFDHPHGVDWIHCSLCGRREPNVPAAKTPYCPSCGADMRGEGEK